MMHDKSDLERRSVLRAAVWVTPVVGIALSAPAASASVGGTLRWRSWTFAVTGAPFYKPGVQLEAAGGSSPVTSASVQLVFDPVEETGTCFGLSNGAQAGWTMGEYGDDNVVTAFWAGSVPPGEALPPVAFDMRFDITPLAFTATAQSPQAASPEPLFVEAATD
ncbi:hypothetical protein C5E07_18770 [Pseudoclavibacter sp. RFBJ3]|uniref:hypothetical protein n=1 Tax=unclassified Pseudoclavibacter TaxID=2615177 RepID=UPI000CE79345|nr:MULTISPECIES: hypothetical protein [unclassified Pseudoclavibacter]PPF79661.1 hypothetical protein C5C12_18845 [Pseudoclavibacter sp. RFBJ5]PPF88693.1 hypothetical protein C5E07_18770 [Pseudoclavibacter sp. RFBJ3]PPF94247.1 hypothetical protein C5C19_18670 [Pseudoclavibacter sp. RFBH5]PPG18238.1 hypothetical protein C5E13_18475 [Pseudoclavibacter sp. RFBI4]